MLDVDAGNRPIRFTAPVAGSLAWVHVKPLVANDAECAGGQFRVMGVPAAEEAEEGEEAEAEEAEEGEEAEAEDAEEGEEAEEAEAEEAEPEPVAHRAVPTADGATGARIWLGDVAGAADGNAFQLFVCGMEAPMTLIGEAFQGFQAFVAAAMAKREAESVAALGARPAVVGEQLAVSGTLTEGLAMELRTPQGEEPTAFLIVTGDEAAGERCQLRVRAGRARARVEPAERVGNRTRYAVEADLVDGLKSARRPQLRSCQGRFRLNDEAQGMVGELQGALASLTEPAEAGDETEAAEGGDGAEAESSEDSGDSESSEDSDDAEASGE